MSADKNAGYILVLPVLLGLGVVILYPLGRGIYLSLTNYSVLQPDLSEFIGLKNYIEVFGNSTFWLALSKSLILTGSAVALQYVLGLGLAITLRQEVPGIRFFRSIVMVSWVIPIVATVVMFKWMTNINYGIINLVLQKIGLSNLTGYWFGNQATAMPAVIALHLWRNIPFYGIALFAAMQGVPNQLYEAAEIDGASNFDKFRYITLPGIKTMSMILIVLHVLWTFNNFGFAYLATGGGPVNATKVLPVYVYQMSWQNYNLGYAATLGVTMMVVLMAFAIPYVFLTTEGEV